MGEDGLEEGMLGGMLGGMVCLDLDLAMVSPGTGSSGPDRGLKVVAWRMPLPAL